MLKAIVFDAYGTIFNTSDGPVRATERILRKYGSTLDPGEVYAKWKRYHREHIKCLTYFIPEADIFRMDLERIFHEYHIPGIASHDIVMMLAMLGNRNAFPEAASTIDKLRLRYRVYIGSNSDKEPLLSDIRRNRIIVDGCFSSEYLQAYKPHPKFFQLLLNTICEGPEAVLYVGDSPYDDLIGASQVGIHTVWVNRKNDILPNGIPQPLFQVKDLSELSNIAL